MTNATEFELGVSLYSYGGDFLINMTLEDCLADVADMGATDVEILADTHIPGYPNPPSAWVEEWHALLERCGLTPTCYSSWLDTRLRPDRSMRIDEAVPILARDLELAHRLGFTIIRPKLGVVSLDLIPVWPIFFWSSSVALKVNLQQQRATSLKRWQKRTQVVKTC